MLKFGTCPRCQQDVDKERSRTSPIVCNHCGWVISHSEDSATQAMETKFIRFAVIFSLLLVASFLQVVNWDNYSLSVIPLQFKELAGIAQQPDFEEMAKICLDRKKYDCVEREYTRLAQNNEPQALVRLAEFQMQRQKYGAAATSFQKFFKNGGINLEASYEYAQALGELGQVDQAAKYYDYVLGAKPGTLQVTVVENYVKLLMDANRLDQAKKLIEDTRHKGANASMFMEDTFQKIQNRLGGSQSSQHS